MFTSTIFSLILTMKGYNAITDLGTNSSWHTLYENNSSFKLSENNHIGYVDIMDNMLISFDILIESYLTGSIQNIFQIGDSNDDRYPGIYLFGDTSDDSIGYRLSNRIALPYGNQYNFDGISLSQSHNIMVIYTQTSWECYFDGILVHSDYDFAGHELFSNKSIWASRPYDDGESFNLDATITNILIQGYDHFEMLKYIYVENELSWPAANYHCLWNYGTYLATIIEDNDYAMARYIQQTNGNPSVWIGLTNQLNQGEWKWIDGTSCNYTLTGKCIDDIHWDPDEPNNDNGDEYFAELSGGGQISYDVDFGFYNDAPITWTKSFLCNNPEYPGVIISSYENNTIGLNMPENSQCVPFQNISSHQSVTGEYHEVGWIKVISCTETTGSFFIHELDYDAMAGRAISIKFQPPNSTNDDMTIIARPYSNPIIYGLNRNKELSYTYDANGNADGQADMGNWIGTSTALVRLENTCITDTAPNDFDNRIYQACGGGLHGLHISNIDGNGYCRWEYNRYLGYDIDIYFGFAPEICVGNVSFESSNPDTSKYIFVDAALSWESSNDFCLFQYGTYLATIITNDDYEIARYIQQKNGNVPLWIGLTDKDNEDDWKWVDGTSCNYTMSGDCKDDVHWMQNEPNNHGASGQHYGALQTGHGYDGLYDDEYGSTSLKFLCNNPEFPGVIIHPDIVRYSELIQNINESTEVNKVVSPKYGTMINPYFIIEDKITGIKSWGYVNDWTDYSQLFALGNFTPNNDSQAPHRVYGSTSSVLFPCDPFVLNEDYINGYRVGYGYYDDGLVAQIYGIEFHTFQGQLFKCHYPIPIESTVIPGATGSVDLSDTGIIRYDNHFLSGFIIESDDTIHGIQFIFTEITVQPTFHPTIDPTIEPTTANPTVPTIEPTMNPIQGSIGVQSDETNTIIMNTAIGVLSGLMVLALIICCIFRNKQHQYEIYTLANPMVITVGIQFYDENPKEPEIDGYLNNLDGIRIDIKNCIRLFKDALNFKVYPLEYEIQDEELYKAYWTKHELQRFLESQAIKLESNLKNEISEGNDTKYDGLIVLISCHGFDNDILTSDYKRLSKTDIHRIFSRNKPLNRELPRIFIFDCCSGDAERDYNTRHLMDDDLGKNLPLEGEKRILPRQETILWARNERNPDYKLAVINAANEGFQSKMRSDTGSYVISKLTTKLFQKIDGDNKNIKKNNEYVFSQILEEVQEELHAMGKQLIEMKFNNKSGNIRFAKYVGQRIEMGEGQPTDATQEQTENIEMEIDESLEMQPLNNNAQGDEDYLDHDDREKSLMIMERVTSTQL